MKFLIRIDRQTPNSIYVRNSRADNTSPRVFEPYRRVVRDPGAVFSCQFTIIEFSATTDITHESVKKCLEESSEEKSTIVAAVTKTDQINYDELGREWRHCLEEMKKQLDVIYEPRGMAKSAYSKITKEAESVHTFSGRSLPKNVKIIPSVQQGLEFELGSGNVFPAL